MNNFIRIDEVDGRRSYLHAGDYVKVVNIKCCENDSKRYSTVKEILNRSIILTAKMLSEYTDADGVIFMYKGIPIYDFMVVRSYYYGDIEMIDPFFVTIDNTFVSEESDNSSSSNNVYAFKNYMNPGILLEPVVGVACGGSFSYKLPNTNITHINNYNTNDMNNLNVPPSRFICNDKKVLWQYMKNYYEKYSNVNTPGTFLYRKTFAFIQKNIDYLNKLLC